MSNVVPSAYVEGQGVAIGDRIRLTETMTSDPMPIEAGAEGVVESIHLLRGALGHGVQLSVKWDNGRGLMLVVPPDKFEIESGERECGWCGETFNLADGGADFEPEAGGPACYKHEGES